MKILLLQLGCIGDMILLTPVINTISTNFPLCEIEVIASTKNHSVLVDNPAVSKIHIFDKNPIKLFSLIHQIKKIHYNIYIDPKDHHSSEGLFLAKSINADTKIGFNSNGETVFDKCIKSDQENAEIHSISRNLQVARLAFPSLLPTFRPVLYYSDEIKQYTQKFLEPFKGQSLVLVNLSSGSEIRKFSIQKWIDIISKILSEQFQIILLFTEQDKNIGNALQEQFSLPAFPSRSINDVFALIDNMSMVISPDTSIVHIASAYNKPLLAFYNRNDFNYNKFHPLCSNFLSLFTDKDNAPIETIDSTKIIESFDAVWSSSSHKPYGHK